jgi:hypothetical protein
MCMKYITEYYKVPAMRGARILFRGRPAKIVGSSGASLLIVLDGQKKSIKVHPTWEMTYL